MPQPSSEDTGQKNSAPVTTDAHQQGVHQHVREQMCVELLLPLDALERATAQAVVGVRTLLIHRAHSPS